MNDALTLDEIMAIAEAFPVGPPAVTLLRMAGYPASAIRPAGDLNALEYWTRVNDDLAAGIMTDGRNRLLAAARRRYPASPAFGNSHTVTKTLRVLVVGASPSDRPPLRTDKESRAIQEAGQLGHLDIHLALAAQAADLPLIRSVRPDVLHFCCHGEDGCLILMDIHGESHAVPAETIADTLRHYQRTEDLQLRAVILGACAGATLAPAFADVAQTVIAHQTVLDDACGTEFATRLYRELNRTNDIAAAARTAAHDAAHIDAFCKPVINNLIVLPTGP